MAGVGEKSCEVREVRDGKVGRDIRKEGRRRGSEVTRCGGMRERTERVLTCTGSLQLLNTIFPIRDQDGGWHYVGIKRPWGECCLRK